MTPLENFKVDIILPCLDGLEYTKKCIRSIQTNTHVPYHLVLIDNGSTDDTGEYFKSIKNATIITNNVNLGWERALNQGLEVSTAPYVVFANNDIEVTDGWLSKMLRYFELPDTGAIGPKSNAVMGKQSTGFRQSVDETTHLIGFCLLVKRSILNEIREINYIDETGVSDDHDLSIRIRKAGYKLRIANDVYVHHHFSKTISEIHDYKPYVLERRRKLRRKWGINTIKDIFIDGYNRIKIPPIIVTTDDVCPCNLPYFEYWHYIKTICPELKLIAFVTANHKNEENIREDDEFQKWFEETRDWVQVGVHGYDHLNPPEQERDEAEDLVNKSLDLLRPYLPKSFLYRPPGFQRTIRTEPILEKLGFAGIAYERRIRFFGGQIIGGVLNSHCCGKFINPMTKWQEWLPIIKVR
jgi:GT2 family glycosyltransferase